MILTDTPAGSLTVTDAGATLTVADADTAAITLRDVGATMLLGDTP